MSWPDFIDDVYLCQIVYCSLLSFFNALKLNRHAFARLDDYQSTDRYRFH